MLWVLLFWSLLAARAAEPAPIAPETPAEAAPPLHPLTSPFEQVLAAAKHEYFAGRPNQALPLFETLQRRIEAGEQIPPEIAADALVYLGDVHLSQGRIEAAKLAFRQALAVAPEYLVNPYHHPVEVGYYFDRAREEVEAERAASAAPPPPPRPPIPLWGYLPFGVPQVAQGQPGRGLLYGGLQLGLGVTSLAVMVDLQDENGTWWAPREWREEEYEAGWRRIQTRRWAVQLPAFFGFYAVWAISVADGRETWKSTPVPVLGVTPTGRGPTMGVAWRF